MLNRGYVVMVFIAAD